MPKSEIDFFWERSDLPEYEKPRWWYWPFKVCGFGCDGALFGFGFKFSLKMARTYQWARRSEPQLKRIRDQSLPEDSVHPDVTQHLAIEHQWWTIDDGAKGHVVSFVFLPFALKFGWMRDK